MAAFRFTFRLPVRYSDLDAQGHVNHAKYFSFKNHLKSIQMSIDKTYTRR